MTKPQRVAIVSVPVLSLGVLSWLPLLYLYLRDATRPPRMLGVALMLLVTTCALVAALVANDRGAPMFYVYATLHLCMIVLSTVLAWIVTLPMPARDPYA